MAVAALAEAALAVAGKLGREHMSPTYINFVISIDKT